MSDRMINDISKLIEEEFDEPEVREVAAYVMSRLTLTELSIRASELGKTEVSVPPESLYLMLRYDSNMTNNKFYQEFLFPIRTQLAAEESKMHSMKLHLRRGIEKQDKNSLQIAKSLFWNRFDTLTLIAFLYKGAGYSNRFDFLLRSKIELPHEYVKFFKEHGI